MPIGSVTKQFTAFAALLLAERGELDLDRGIRDYLPELPVLKGVATIRQLLQHMGGYRDYLDTAFADGFALKPPGETLRYQSRQTTVNFAPGEAQVYSNSGYFMVSLAMERAADKPFEEILYELIFEPLGLRSTVSLRNDWPVMRGLATAYVPLPEGGYRRGVNVSEERLGDGAIYSTAEDMLIWLAEIRGQRSLGKAGTWSAFLMRPQLPNERQSDYALGLQIDEYRGARIIGHGGGVMGAVSYIATLPDHNLDVVVLANTITSSKKHVHGIVDALLGEALDPVPPPPATEAYKALLGKYHCRVRGTLIEFEDVDGVLGLSELGEPAVPLSSVSTETGKLPFFHATPVGDTQFEADLTKAVDELTVYDAGQKVQYTRLIGPPPAAEEVVAEAGGAYRCEDIETTVTLRLADGRLVLHADGPFSRNLLLMDPVAPDMLSAKHALMPFAAAFTIIRENGAVSALEYSTGRTWRLRFERTACA